MENKNIETILKDLYDLDPNLKQHEPVLRDLIIKLIEIKPQIAVDQQFVNILRAELLVKGQTSIQTSPKWDFRWNYAIGTLAIAAIAVVSLFYLNIPMKSTPLIKDVADSGFGPLATIQESSDSISMRSQAGGGGFGGDMAMAPMGTGDRGGGGMTGESLKIAPYPGEITKIVYEYEGEEFTQNDEIVPVYKRVVDESQVRSATNNILKSGFELIDLSNLRSPVLTDINISEQSDRGYNISLNLREGWLSMFQNWEKWPQPMPCHNELSCQKQSFIEESQLPSDQAIIATADTFLDKYRIDRDDYGPGIVNKSWKGAIMQFPRSIETGTQLIPYDVSVVYPLLINGQEVYEEWGGLVGIMVSVNVRENQVTSAHGIGIQTYERSNYKAETNVQKILDLAKIGGTNQNYFYETPTKIITVKLGTPKKQLMQIYQYKTGRAEMLYVPSLVFPVQSISDNQYFYRESVVIPLPLELIEQRLAPIPIPGDPIRIMPAVPKG